MCVLLRRGVGGLPPHVRHPRTRSGPPDSVRRSKPPQVGREPARLRWSRLNLGRGQRGQIVHLRTGWRQPDRALDSAAELHPRRIPLCLVGVQDPQRHRARVGTTWQACRGSGAGAPPGRDGPEASVRAAAPRPRRGHLVGFTPIGRRRATSPELARGVDARSVTAPGSGHLVGFTPIGRRRATSPELARGVGARSGTAPGSWPPGQLRLDRPPACHQPGTGERRRCAQRHRARVGTSWPGP